MTLPKLASLFLLFLAGFAALSWQVLWHLDLSLALGVSARGAALTVGTVMAGMMAGALWAGKWWKPGRGINPWRVYALLEGGIGLSAWLPSLSQRALETMDARAYESAPWLAAPLSILLLALTLGPAAFLMGASLPVMGLIAGREGIPLSRLYAANTLGAAGGTLVVALALMPAFGREGSALAVTGLDLLIALLALGMARKLAAPYPESGREGAVPELAVQPMPMKLGLLLCVVTGIVTFGLEVVWFRLLKAAWLSTTDSFAVMLFCFLLSLGLGAWLSKSLRKTRITVPLLLCGAAVAIWLGTAFIERFDGWASAGGAYGPRLAGRVLAALLAMGPAVLLLGVSLPALMDERAQPRQWARLYAANTLGAALGSLLAGWWLISWLGPVKSAWVLGGLLLAVAVPALSSRHARAQALVVAVLALGAAWAADSGIGVTRVQGPTTFVRHEHRILAHQNGPDVTASVVRTRQGFTLLFMDGYAASGEAGGSTVYMDAMGRLPMLLHPSPKDALVICFGTGQTLRAVLDENPGSVDMLEVNAAVFELADHFVTNRGALKDPRVRSRVMDGRAWLRRSKAEYDVVTLEPMPPFFAGSNSLYSVEFYELIRSRLREGGCLAQWFPIHLLTPSQARAVAAAFLQVFPNSVLWFDPQSTDASGARQQGVLIARKGDGKWTGWPGFAREAASARPYAYDVVNQGILLSVDGLAKYVEGVEPVTDDNQILSFGSDSLQRHDLARRSVASENWQILTSLYRQLNEVPTESPPAGR